MERENSAPKKFQKQYLERVYTRESHTGSSIIDIYSKELNCFSLTHSLMVCPVLVYCRIEFPLLALGIYSIHNRHPCNNI